MIKHIGRHNSKKIVILYRTVPNEDHMALVAYSDLLPRTMHDEIMKVLESPVGQQAENLADALFRNIGADGRNSLEALHRDGLIKKIQTNQVQVTPTTTSSVRLDELNKILAEMATGEAAVKRLGELDQSKGFADISKLRNGQPVVQPSPAVETAPINDNAEAVVTVIVKNEPRVLTTEESRKDLRSQALRIRQEAKQMIVDAQKLEEQARQLKNPNGKNAAVTS